jgi:uncharacterized membrane protein YeaQ/YmgE (transglycosylase-associated protein family)
VDLNLVGWIVVGFVAGALSAAVVPGRAARGCLSTILVGVLGASSAVSWPASSASVTRAGSSGLSSSPSSVP